MLVPVIMPRQGQSVESCVITKWYKSKGDTVKVGDILFSYETDKASFEEEARVNGTLLDIFYNEGDDVEVLSNVCVIAAEGASDVGFGTHSTDKLTAKADANTEKEEVIHIEKISDNKSEFVLQESKSEDYGDILRISPRAEKIAEKLGVDLKSVVPSGPYGRIIERDIEKANDSATVFTLAAKYEGTRVVSSKLEGTGIGGRITTQDLDQANREGVLATPQIPEYAETKLSNMRKVIAGAMQLSLSGIPQLTLNSSFDATDILSLRKKLKVSQNSPDFQAITINDMMLFAISRTILHHKELNAHLTGDTIKIFRNVHIGVAVDTEKGLMVPTIFNADLLTLKDISKKAKELAKMCVDGAVSPDVLKGASFTITNLGTLGIETFTPVINPPQTGILGIGSIDWKVREENGTYKYYPAIGLSLTFDHRALDGAPAARFLKHLKSNLENFTALLVN